jgi:polysaccharide biosynthesis protein PslG
MRKPFVAAIAAIAAIALPAAATASPPTQFFGVMKGQPLDRHDFHQLKSAGVGAMRFAVNWYAVQPHRRSRNWGAIDKLVGDLAARGIQPVPFVYGSPKWVAKRAKRPPIQSAADVGAWRAFLTMAVDRYGPAGAYWTGPYRTAHPGATPIPIQAWQIWNEPNLRKFFPHDGMIRKYAKLLEISHAAITSADPAAKVVVAGMPGYARPSAWAFLDKLYRVNGIKQYFDATAVHPYSATIGQFKDVLRKMRRVMSDHQDSQTPLWLTELGWGSAQPNPKWPVNKGDKGQARMLTKAFRAVLDRRTSWHIGRLFWFDWRDPAGGTGHYCSFCDSAGLLRHNHKPKPAFRAYRHFARGR